MGTATYTDAKGGGPLKEGEVLMQGATITTGAGSYVDLDLGVNGNALRVEADSTLSLDKLDYTKAIETVVNTEVEVKKGSAVANVVTKLSKASKYEIKTPAGVAGIRGTVVRAGTARIVCLIGRVQFRPVAGGGVQMVVGGMVYAVGSPAPVRATAVETRGLAHTGVTMTAHTASSLVNAVVQQFSSALVAEAAAAAGKAGGNIPKAAADAARGIVAELLQRVEQAAAQAPPQLRAALLAAARDLRARSGSIIAMAAGVGAQTAVINGGGTQQEAILAGQNAVDQSGGPKVVLPPPPPRSSDPIPEAPPTPPAPPKPPQDPKPPVKTEPEPVITTTKKTVG
ncbi:MAG: FecR domain-containing protein [Limisphaerales bacterium]